MDDPGDGFVYYNKDVKCKKEEDEACKKEVFNPESGAGKYTPCFYHGEVAYEAVVGSVHHFFQLYDLPVFAKYCCSNTCRALAYVQNLGRVGIFPKNYEYGSNCGNGKCHQKYTFKDGKCWQSGEPRCFTMAPDYMDGDECANPGSCLYGSDCDDCGKFAVCNEDPKNPGEYSGEKRIMEYALTKRHWFVETDATKEKALKEQSPSWDPTPSLCSQCSDRVGSQSPAQFPMMESKFKIPTYPSSSSSAWARPNWW